MESKFIPNEFALRRQVMEQSNPNVARALAGKLGADHPQVRESRQLAWAAEAVTGVAWKIYKRQPDISASELSERVSHVFSHIFSLEQEPSDSNIVRMYGDVEQYLARKTPYVYKEDGHPPFFSQKNPAHTREVLKLRSFFSTHPDYLPFVIDTASSVVAVDQNEQSGQVAHTSTLKEYMAVKDVLSDPDFEGALRQQNEPKPARGLADDLALKKALAEIEHAKEHEKGLYVNHVVNTVVRRIYSAKPDISLEDLRAHANNALLEARKAGTMDAVDGYLCKKGILKNASQKFASVPGCAEKMFGVLVDCFSKDAHLQPHYVNRAVEKIRSERICKGRYD